MSDTTVIWAVTEMSCYPQEAQQTDVVFRVSWSCTGRYIDGLTSFNAVQVGAVGVEYTSGDPFTPHNQLTQEQVLSWCYANGVDRAATEAAVGQQIANQVNPPVVTPRLPWTTA